MGFNLHDRKGVDNFHHVQPLLTGDQSESEPRRDVVEHLLFAIGSPLKFIGINAAATSYESLHSC